MSNISSYRSTSNRVTGLMSGLDVDGLVKASLSGQQAKIDKAAQNKTKLQWKQEAYRSVISKLNDFQSNYLDILNPKSVLRKSSMNAYTASVSADAQNYVKVSAGSDSRAANVKINSISSIATAQTIQSKSDNKLSSPIKMTIDKNNIKDFAGKSISVTLDGVTKTITLGDEKSYRYNSDDDSSPFSIEKFTDDVNNKLQAQFGTMDGRAKVQLSAPENVSDIAGVDKWSLTFEMREGSSIKVTSSAASALGMVNNAANSIDTSKSISSLFDGSINRGISYDAFGNQIGSSTNKLTTSGGNVSFTINGVNFDFSSSTSLKDIMNKVNASDAGVKMSYSSLTDGMTITSTKTGSGDNIVMRDNNGTDLLAQLFGTDETGAMGNKTDGTDAVLTVNNVEIVRSSNNFTLEGINFELLAATPDNFGDITVENKVDSTQMMDTIKGFVEGYNKLIEELNSILTEKVSKDYNPLTDAQKEAMTEKQIENWEAEAKKGILKGDAALSRMLTSLRSAFMNTVELADGGGKKSFASIGISTSAITSENGKLTIDETKLKAAIEEDPDVIIKMFTQTSDIPKNATVNSAYAAQGYDTQAKLNNARNSQLGAAQRFSEIFNSNLSSIYGSEGALIKIAGTGKNTLIDRNSTLAKQLTAIEKNISNYQKKLYSAEDKLYAKYSALETAYAKMEKQNSSISALSSN